MSKIEVDAIEPQSGTTLTIGASGDSVNIASGATITDFTSTGIDDNATSTAITIDSSQRVGIGTSSIDANASVQIENGESYLVMKDAQQMGIKLYGDDTNVLYSYDKTADSLTGGITFGHSDGTMFFYTNGINERMRITSAGDLLVGKTVTTGTVVGCILSKEGYGFFTRLASTVLFANRQSDDGTVMAIQQAGTEEGNISVSGGTVSYNGFTGSHWSRFIDESKPDVLRGTVMESLDQMTDWYHVEFETPHTEKDADGNDVVKTLTNKKPYALKANEKEGDVITYAWNTEKKDEEGNDIIEQVQATILKQKDVKHMMSKISDTVEAKNVYGVFSAWDNDDLINNDFYVASVGSYVVRIKAGQVVAKGDLLQSNGDGTAKVQSDDAVKSSSFAKVLSTTIIETYEDGSYLVPCSLMC
jgi:hypothetical protein